MRVQDQKSGKLRLNLHVTSFWKENQLVWTKKQSSKESSWFGEPRMGLGTKVLESNSRIQFASNQSKLVPRKLDLYPRKMGLSTCFWVLNMGAHGVMLYTIFLQTNKISFKVSVQWGFIKYMAFGLT